MRVWGGGPIQGRCDGPVRLSRRIKINRLIKKERLRPHEESERLYPAFMVCAQFYET